MAGLGVSSASGHPRFRFPSDNHQELLVPGPRGPAPFGRRGRGGNARATRLAGRLLLKALAQTHSPSSQSPQASSAPLPPKASPTVEHEGAQDADSQPLLEQGTAAQSTAWG